MSSKYVRDQIKPFITTNYPAESLVDFSAEYNDVKEIREKYGLGRKDPFIGIMFIPSTEVPIGIVSNNAGGCYRENGAILLHVVEPVSTANHRESILDRGETLLGLFRGATINGDIIVESISHPNFDSSATVNFDNGYEAAVIVINFYRNNNF